MAAHVQCAKAGVLDSRNDFWLAVRCAGAGQVLDVEIRRRISTRTNVEVHTDPNSVDQQHSARRGWWRGDLSPDDGISLARTRT
jgi:hypothetical protein